MKRIFTLFASLLMTIALFAAAPRPSSMLTIQSMSRGDMKVVIDGRQFDPRSNFMRLQGIQPGYHKIAIFMERAGGHFNHLGRRYERVFSGSITVRNRTNLTITIDRNGRPSLKESRFDGYKRNGRINDRDDRRYDRRDDRRIDDRDIWGDDYKQGQDFYYDTDGRMGDYDWNNGLDNDRFSQAMNDREFAHVIDGMQKEWLESNKMKSATHIINTNFLTSAQVRQMMQLFSFENNKVDLAKQAYAKTVDQRNFLSTVSDQLSFSSSRDELARFIRNAR